MNEYELLRTPKRNQTLLLVEGKHEKNVLIEIILKCFPKLPINTENIHIYGTDIYDLYHAIVKEYGEDWYQQELEIDIPMLISRKKNIIPALDKRNFTNILLMFDYEHHDNFYSDDKIIHMQSHFNSAAEDGILYINYPMIESYQDMISIPDKKFLNKYISVTMNPGRKYKNEVHKKSVVWKYTHAYEKMRQLLLERTINIKHEEINDLLYRILLISKKNNLEQEIEQILAEVCLIDASLKYPIKNIILSLGYLEEEISYWKRMCSMLTYIIEQNIVKAFTIQGGVPGNNTKKQMYYAIDFLEILKKQNSASKDEVNGIIWILCTCVTFLGEYKFFWNDVE